MGPLLTERESLFTTMARIRAFERRVASQFREGNVHGFVHVSIGQEGIAAGACAALREGDPITTTHRGHGHCIAKGADVEAMFAELFGRADGICGGKGGSMHIADPALGILGANGIVGAGIPLATGAALAARVRGDGRVAVAFFGEGAVHSGAFHEGVGLAVAWRLPVVFVCENNGYVEFTRADHWPEPPLEERAKGYGLRYYAVGGEDPERVRATVGKAVERARAGKGPAFVEASATRLGGHYEGDAQQYRSAEETADASQNDSLELFAERLETERAAAIRAAAEAEMDAAMAAALAAPYPSADDVLADVYG